MLIKPVPSPIGGDTGRSVGAPEELVDPSNEVFPVWSVGVATVVLAPGQLTLKDPHIYRRHFLFVIVIRRPEVSRAQEPEHRSGGHSRHVTSLVVQPFRIALLRHAIADKRQPGRAQSDEFTSIDGKVVRVLAAEGP